MYKLLHNTYLLLSNIHKYSYMRMYGRGGSRMRWVYDNGVKGKFSNAMYKNIEKTEMQKYIEKLFTCEITNKPKRPGTEDCNCEFMCMVKKSETQTIEDNMKCGAKCRVNEKK
jgi:hypothetical protein